MKFVLVLLLVSFGLSIEESRSNEPSSDGSLAAPEKPPRPKTHFEFEFDGRSVAYSASDFSRLAQVKSPAGRVGLFENLLRHTPRVQALVGRLNYGGLHDVADRVSFFATTINQHYDVAHFDATLYWSGIRFILLSSALGVDQPDERDFDFVTKHLVPDLERSVQSIWDQIGRSSDRSEYKMFIYGLYGAFFMGDFDTRVGRHVAEKTEKITNQNLGSSLWLQLGRLWADMNLATRMTGTLSGLSAVGMVIASQFSGRFTDVLQKTLVSPTLILGAFAVYSLIDSDILQRGLGARIKALFQLPKNRSDMQALSEMILSARRALSCEERLNPSISN